MSLFLSAVGGSPNDSDTMPTPKEVNQILARHVAFEAALTEMMQPEQGHNPAPNSTLENTPDFVNNPTPTMSMQPRFG